MELETNYSVADLKILLSNNEIRSEGYLLEEFELIFQENAHSKINIDIKVKKEYKNDWGIYTREDVGNQVENNISFDVLLKKRKCFSGIVQNIIVMEEDSGDIKIKLEALSKSEKMDRVKRYRVYQNPQIKYIDIIREIAGRYNDEINILGIELENNDTNILSEKIKKGLIIQYYETDWEFLIRIASHLKMAVFSMGAGEVSIGFMKGIESIREWNKNNGNIGRGIDKFNNISYYLTSVDFYNLTDNIIENDKKNMGIVTNGYIGYKNGKFYGEYSTKQKDYIYEYIPNENIKGCMIEGNVMSLPITKNGKIAIMTVDFYSGLQKTASNKSSNIIGIESGGDWFLLNNKEERFNFPYTTPYSKTNTGYFCTPEVMDTVAVNFPTTEESEGYVVWAVNNEGSIRFSNPYVRNYTTKFENTSEEVCYDFRLNESSYLVECAEDAREIFNNKIVECKNNILVNSKNNVIIENANEISLITKIYDVEVGENYTESVKSKKSCEYGELTEDISKARKVRCEIYDVTTGAYKVKQ